MLEQPVGDATKQAAAGGVAGGACADAQDEGTRLRDADRLIAAARSGCARSAGELAQRYRKYLLHVANLSLSPAIRAKVAPSDLVQETLLHVHQHIGAFRGETEEELKAWLRQLLYFRALHAARRYGQTAARDVRRELPLDNSGVDLPPLVDPAMTPCAGNMVREQYEGLYQALAALQPEARRLVLLRVVERMTFVEIGQALGCTADAARARWVRAIRQLRLRTSDD